MQDCGSASAQTFGIPLSFNETWMYHINNVNRFEFKTQIIVISDSIIMQKYMHDVWNMYSLSHISQGCAIKALEVWSTWSHWLITGKCGRYFNSVNSQINMQVVRALAVKFLPGECHKASLMGSQYSIFVRVTAWYRQATNDYMSKCWPIFMYPYGVIQLISRSFQWT